MKLTPEERERIYEEEKARLEAQAQSGPSNPASRPSAASVQIPSSLPNSSKKGPGFLVAVLLGGALVVVVLVSVAFVALIGAMATKTGTDNGRHFDKQSLLDAVDTSNVIEVLAHQGIVHKVEVFEGGVAIVVGPGFYQQSYDRKVMAMKLVTFVVQPSSGVQSFVLYDWQTHAKVGYWSTEYGLRLDER